MPQSRRNDFTFKVGLNNSPSTWAAAPAPSTVSVRIGAGTGGGDRVELTWTDGSIKEEWLEVTIHADANTGLSAPYTFFYGSVIANSGTGDTGALAITSSTDENAARNHNGTATVTNVFDYNKDGFVNSSDENAARNNGATIKFIKIAANTPLAPDAAPTVTPDLSVAPAVTPDTMPHGQQRRHWHGQRSGWSAGQPQDWHASAPTARLAGERAEERESQQRRGSHDLRGPGRGRHESHAIDSCRGRQDCRRTRAR